MENKVKQFVSIFDPSYNRLIPSSPVKENPPLVRPFNFSHVEKYQIVPLKQKRRKVKKKVVHYGPSNVKIRSLKQ